MESIMEKNIFFYMGTVKLDGEEAVLCQAKPTLIPLLNTDFLKAMWFVFSDWWKETDI